MTPLTYKTHSFSRVPYINKWHLRPFFYPAIPARHLESALILSLLSLSQIHPSILTHCHHVINHLVLCRYFTPPLFRESLESFVRHCHSLSLSRHHPLHRLLSCLLTGFHDYSHVIHHPYWILRWLRKCRSEGRSFS